MSTLTATRPDAPSAQVPRARTPVPAASSGPAPRPAAPVTSPATDLLGRARRGDQAAWRALVRGYNGLILATCRRCGLPPASCEDVAQTTWLRLFQHVDQLRDDAALPAWLVITSRREALTTLRRERRQVPCDETTFDTRPEADPDDLDQLVFLGVVRHQVRVAMGSLSERDQRLLAMLFHPAQLSYQQVAELLGLPVGSIGPLRQRALRRLRRRLGNLDPQVDGAPPAPGQPLTSAQDAAPDRF